MCATDAAEYGETVLWTEAAYDADFEGLIYPSSKAGGRAAMVFFGDRIDESDFEVDGSYWWSFDEVAGFNRMVEVCPPPTGQWCTPQEGSGGCERRAQRATPVCSPGPRHCIRGHWVSPHNLLPRTFG